MPSGGCKPPSSTVAVSLTFGFSIAGSERPMKNSVASTAADTPASTNRSGHGMAAAGAAAGAARCRRSSGALVGHRQTPEAPGYTCTPCSPERMQGALEACDGLFGGATAARPASRGLKLSLARVL